MTKELKVVIQPVKMKSALEIWDSDETPIAKIAWVRGPKKPRDLLRSTEKPPIDVSLEALEKMGLVKVLEPIKISSPEDVKKISDDVDAILIGDSEDWLADESLLDALASLNKPLLVEWDSWGYSIHGRISKFRFKRYRNVKRYYTMGASDVLSLIRALRGWKTIRTLKVLYIGRYPSHSVAASPEITFDKLKERFDSEVVQIGFKEYVEEVDSVSDAEVKDVVEEWKRNFVFLDNRANMVKHYAKIYVALKKLMNRYGANSLTVDCAGLPDLEYVPCLAFSLLINEGVPCGCEGDLPTLYTLALLMGVSGKPALMGNLNENVTHSDIENNIVVVNHDVVPPYFACIGCKYYVRDYHAMGKGATPYTELIEGMDVTLAGMHWDMDSLWATQGKVVWTKDFVHCRLGVGVKVENAKKVSKEAFGHHVALIYGNYIEELERAIELLGLKFVKL